MSAVTSSLRIEPVAVHHQVSAFNCGDPSINTYIQTLFNDAGNEDLSQLYTAVDKSDRIMGFYSISSANIEFEEIPDSFSRSLNTYPVPAIKIDAIAVDIRIQKNGLGARLLIDALQRIYNLKSDINVRVVLVEAITAQLRTFYLHYGFSPLSRDKSRLFLPIDKVTTLFS